MEFRNRDEEEMESPPLPPPSSSSLGFNPTPIRSSAFSKPSSSLISPRGGGGSSRNGDAFANPLLSDQNTTTTTATTTTTTTPPRYGECLRNHAAASGGHVVDGCGEFMPAAADPLKCVACGCHRSFHRKDASNNYPQQQLQLPSSARGFSLPLALPPPIHPHHQIPYPIAFGGGATTESSSEERHPTAAGGSSRKRFRTKFTADQKERMLRFAERIGWRISKQDEGLVEEFCKEVGVRRQVLKVWMHNNKHVKQQHQIQQQSQQEEES